MLLTDKKKLFFLDGRALIIKSIVKNLDCIFTHLVHTTASKISPYRWDKQEEIC